MLVRARLVRGVSRSAGLRRGKSLVRAGALRSSGSAASAARSAFVAASSGCRARSQLVRAGARRLSQGRPRSGGLVSAASGARCLWLSARGFAAEPSSSAPAPSEPAAEGGAAEAEAKEPFIAEESQHTIYDQWTGTTHRFPKTTTGKTGLYVVSNAREVLTAMYEKLLAMHAESPPNPYFRDVGKHFTYRLTLLKDHTLTLKEIEEKIGMGQLEELIEEAEDELELTPKYAKWRLWEGPDPDDTPTVIEGIGAVSVSAADVADMKDYLRVLESEDLLPHELDARNKAIEDAKKAEEAKA